MDMKIMKRVKIDQSVQEISMYSELLSDIPSDFVQPIHHQPGKTTKYHGPTPGIPVIDLGSIDRDNVARQVAEACKEWGLFQVVNHGIPEEVIKELQRVGKQFFELPQDEKDELAMGLEFRTFQGYGSMIVKRPKAKKIWSDFFFHHVWPPSLVDYSYWPNSLPGYREANEEYAKYMQPLAAKLFENLSLGLGLEKHVFREAMGGDEIRSFMKINYYPVCPRPELAIGITIHTDIPALTIISPNEVEGLQVNKNGEWVDVKYVPNALVVQIGDQTEILTNGNYKSVPHRVTVNKEKVRISWATFIEPPPEKVIGPLPEFVNEENPAKFKTMSYYDFQDYKVNVLHKP